jgi:hypothetical protein
MVRRTSLKKISWWASAAMSHMFAADLGLAVAGQPRERGVDVEE